MIKNDGGDISPGVADAAARDGGDLGAGAGATAARAGGLSPKALATRERILGAALELFREKGFDETTMRDIAAGAGLATGAAYYYFRSKDELVLAFYEATHGRIEAELAGRLDGVRGLEARILVVADLWTEHFAPHRHFIRGLFRTASDPASALSPFAQGTVHIRSAAIGWFERVQAGAPGAIPEDMRGVAAPMMWLGFMAYVFYWIHDGSPGQTRSRRVLTGCLELLTLATRLARLPLTGPVRRKLVAIALDAGIESLARKEGPDDDEP